MHQQRAPHLSTPQSLSSHKSKSPGQHTFQSNAKHLQKKSTCFSSAVIILWFIKFDWCVLFFHQLNIDHHPAYHTTHWVIFVSKWMIDNENVAYSFNVLRGRLIVIINSQVLIPNRVNVLIPVPCTKHSPINLSSFWFGLLPASARTVALLKSISG